jgi:hypothetical protein
MLGNDALAQPPSGVLDRYLLRDLMWCALCDRPLVAVLGPADTRHYGCLNERCPRPLLDAEVVEQQVWTRFVRLNDALAHGVRRDARHSMLRQLLKQVTVGDTTVDLAFEWRD